ncbi:MAG: hypothetical protein FJX39_07755, partial [Alphaproteobacteria bacterium]|nr:hypothetical protein [Alphaproteobacteria bacterium]
MTDACRSTSVAPLLHLQCAFAKPYRERDEAIGLPVMAGGALADFKTGKNGQHLLFGKSLKSALHVACTAFLTFYRVCAKRGSLLANVIGVVVHDHWKPYYTMDG